MTASPVRRTNGTGSTGTTSSLAFTAPAVGNTLLVAFEMPTANGAPTVTDNLGNSYTIDVSKASLWHSGYSGYIARKSNLTNAPTQLNIAGSSGSFAAIITIDEVAGLDNSSPVSQTVSVDGSGSVVNQTLTRTTTTDNEYAFIMCSTANLRAMTADTAGCTSWLNAGTNSNKNGFSNPDTGAAGSKSYAVTYSGTTNSTFFGAFYKASVVLPNISVDDVTVDNLSGKARLTISLDKPWASDVSVYRKTTDDTATSPDDFTELPIELVTFAPGETEKTAVVTLVP